jgi:hypothetical protein
MGHQVIWMLRHLGMVLALGAAACAPAATPTVTPTRIRPTRTLTPAAPTPAWATPTAAPALTITLAKLERKGDEVRVWIAFRKAGPASGRASFHLNIRDDRGNTYPSDPYTVDLSVPDIRFVVDRMDLALLPVGFTWVRSATVEMPAIAPIHSILVYGDPLEHGVSLDPQSAKWPTIDLDVVRKNDLTGKSSSYRGTSMYGLDSLPNKRKGNALAGASQCLYRTRTTTPEACR